jgi:hypothetical protein
MADALSLAIGAAVTTALPISVAESATIVPEPPMPAWVVGTPGEFDWQFSVGRTADDAIRNYICERIGGDGCEEGGKPDCDCEWCDLVGSVEAERKPMWDGKREADIKPGDWLRSGTGHICSRCSYETFPEEGGHGIGDEAVCSECMTVEDWDIVDPERAAELRERMAERKAKRPSHEAR